MKVSAPGAVTRLDGKTFVSTDRLLLITAGRETPFAWIVELGVKFAPVIVTCNWGQGLGNLTMDLMLTF